MKALLYSDWETFHVVETPEPTPIEGEVRLKVQAAGICGSELEAIRNRSPRRVPPLILGHEFTGVIDRVGPGVKDWRVGDEVVANAVIPDGTCPPCLRGKTNLCLNRHLFGMNRPGAFAEFVCVPTKVLIHRPPGADAKAAALTEPLANGVHITNLLKDTRPDKVLLFGAGPIGLLTMQALRVAFGAKVAVVDRAESRKDLAGRLGAEATFLPQQEKEIADWADSDGYAATVDAVGAPATQRASISFLRRGGTAVWIGLQENSPAVNSFDVILAEKRIQGSYACTQEELEQALRWLADAKVDASSWTSIFSLEQAELAMSTMLHPGPQDVKAVIAMS